MCSRALEKAQEAPLDRATFLEAALKPRCSIGESGSFLISQAAQQRLGQTAIDLRGRPIPAVGQRVEMLRCGPSKLPFMFGTKADG